MEINEAILTRRSIRKYTKEQISDTQVETLLKAGMYAPSAVNKQPWHFIVFRDKNKVDEIIKVHPNASMLKDASLGILVCFDENLQHDNGYGLLDCSAATQNILLAAHGMGLGACWIGIYPRKNRIEALKNVFNLPGHVVPLSVISAGYPAEKKSRPERFLKERIHNESW